MPRFPVHEVTQGRLIELLAEHRPEREALIYPDRGLRLNYADLERRSRELARGLVALGVEPGERVCVWADNRPDWIPLQLAVARIGALLVTANTALTRGEIDYLLRQSRSCAVVSSSGRHRREYYDALAAIDTPELRHRVGLDDGAPESTIPIEQLVAAGAGVDDARIAELTARTHVDDAANIQYTSGTTGFPKGVVLTHRNIVENAYIFSRELSIDDDDRMLLQVPLFHCFGCVICVLGALTHGVPLVALQSFDPAAALQAIASERVTVAHGVPTMFLAMLTALQDPHFESWRPETLRTGMMAGTSCPEPLMRRVIDEMGCPGMVIGYGLTEASPGISVSRPADPAEIRCATVGRVVPPIEVQIVDPSSGRLVGAGEAGELWARGPNIMQGYFDDEAATADAITPEGWLRTGDLATQDNAGRIRIVGRIKEMIIRGGENVYPAEVEDALRAHDGVRDAAVFGMPDDRLGEIVAAAVIREPGRTLTRDELLDFLEDRLAPYKRPQVIAFVDELPFTPSGKVQKFKLAAHCGLGGLEHEE